ncbi:nodulation protein NodH [Acidimangrovimonas sediminis]|uniref:nodulation protein NodH n=1 Tax=Acidimangrovimonas sediminis TaxID=2056283 RepID=UPI001E28C353|nr:nodulation protein NodH [Acidimangrovimonas sediminis]
MTDQPAASPSAAISPAAARRGRFDFFVILAEMRTGSNFLEANLNEFASLRCLGEAFNPVFVAHKNQDDLYGIDLAAREADPLELVRRMVEHCDGLPGFRFFHDHDPRVLEHIMANPRCAKVVLTRNPLESYVSLRIANETGQWKLTNVKHQRQAQVRFDPVAFESHLEKIQAFQIEIMHALQITGQTAFYIDYEDIGDVEVLNGLAAFLGTDERIEAVSTKLKVQNPEATADKVRNPEEMEAALARLDRFNLSRTPNFEPRRGPAVPGFWAGDGAGILYMPVKAGPEAQVCAWLEAAGGGLVGSFTQKSLRQWKRRHDGHRSFTVVRHPVPRAYAAFCADVLGEENRDFRVILKRYQVAVPEEGADLATLRAGFVSFLGFLKKNLAGQTSVRIDGAWASQSVVLQGFAKFQGPDLVIREERLAEGLAYLAAEVGIAPPALPADPDVAPYPLAALYDESVEAAAREAYQRDYMSFGWGKWG